jgi:3-hydroxyisobutyrate dehydrogenase
MARIGFIGVGNMGGPMARNLLKAGHRVRVFDPRAGAVEPVVAAGGQAASGAAEAAREAEAVITMLPAGEQAREVYLGAGGLIGAAPKGALLVDCSTIDVASARSLHEAAAKAGYPMLDAPVSGGVAGAEAASLTFMVGGGEAEFVRARPILAAMGKAIVHAGGPGNGQAAKICNNMILGASMIAVCEAFVLAEGLGLDPQRLFDISSVSSGQCWSLTTYCPVPGPVPTSPANRDYRPGFTAAMMLKDLKLAVGAAAATGAEMPIGGSAAALYQRFVDGGGAQVDFSGIIKMLRGAV